MTRLRHIKVGNEKPAAGAFTLVELLVVIAIIGVLVAAVVVAGSTLVGSAKARKSTFMLGLVRDAIEQFQQEQRDRPTLTKPRAYQNRYGFYPPDELEVFTAIGIPPAGPAGSRAVGGGEVIPGPANSITFGPMTFRQDGLDDGQRSTEHRDLAALVLALDMFCESAANILEKIPAPNWDTPRASAAGLPLQYLDRNGNQAFDPGVDQEIRLLIDDWGVPLTYLAQRDGDPGDADTTKSSNGENWNQASTAMVRLNGGQPVIASYGPNGPEQLSSEMIAAAALPEAPRATLETDWDDNQKIDSPLNEDNIYPDESLREIVLRGTR